jgi:hypothetical protein
MDNICIIVSDGVNPTRLPLTDSDSMETNFLDYIFPEAGIYMYSSIGDYADLYNGSAKIESPAFEFTLVFGSLKQLDEKYIPDTIARSADLELKAAKSDHEALAGRVTAAEADIDALEGKVGDKTVAKQIEDAITALKIGDYAKAADLTAAITQHNTDKVALETEIGKKANDADLAAIAKTGSTDDLVQGELVLVFDCGTSAV